MGHAAEVESGQRFEFGENWARFLSELSDEKIAAAEASLKRMLGVESLQGKTFLDAGSGSGLFSLAAARLGATVHSFDFDPSSVKCTERIKQLKFPDCERWRIESGSVLDPGYVSALGAFDVVYSWGVLHHTGDMAGAFANIAGCVKPGGLLFVAIYNDQGWVSRYWTWVKRLYNRSNVAKPVLIACHAPYLLGLRWLVRAISGRLSIERGMTIWYDMIDWLGGYPFEVAKPEQVFAYFRDRGFTLTEMTTCGGRMGCNEFVFRLASR
ncbi:class I SAM-dependent methyltransferase [Methylomonas koyamae]|uniref:class I SAM-dependent methyltransferase n=1 Tax=Methylomonas koyamae TaxID=702114 RepID=UPI0028734E37|nr:class I SAM-dependent methyltransferase [Methylomonas koyamae]WNB77142.1 class I SAM-dependent methyltransferase [Methylomonas koyamae]